MGPRAQSGLGCRVTNGSDAAVQVRWHLRDRGSGPGLPPDENGATEGMHALEEILDAAPHTKVIVASGHTDRMSAVKAVAKGAFDYFGKPVDIDELKLIVARAHRMHVLERENRSCGMLHKTFWPGVCVGHDGARSSV